MKQQKQGLTVVEKSLGRPTQHLAVDETDPWRASPSPAATQEGSLNVSRQLSPETKVDPQGFEQNVSSVSRESLSSLPRGKTASPADQAVNQIPAQYASGILDPRMTPIYVDGGNIISTKGGIYRLKMPVNDLDGNDRRKQERTKYPTVGNADRSHSPAAYPQSQVGGLSDYEDDIDPGSKSDSELLPSMRAAIEKRVKFSDGPPQISKVPVFKQDFKKHEIL